jgi:CDP-6-deoxy-D-xylo-4-hexulose-3-dehydrase
MTRPDYWYPTAFSHWGDEEREAMARVIASNRFTMGPEVEAFEAELAAFNQRKHAVMVNSGSSANLIAVAAMMLPAEGNTGHLVSIPALAWATTYAPFVQHGCDLKLRDCDDTWCAPTDFGDEGLDLRVACSILGNPADVDQRVVAGANLNDDCEAFGATIDGRPTASFGTIATQSFYWSHQLSAIEGGACLTNDDDLAQTMRMLRDHGMTRSVYRPAKFEEEYDFRLFGYNVRPLEMHAAIAREQLLKVHAFKAARRRNWSLFARLTEGFPIRLPTMEEGSSPFSIHFEAPSPQRRRDLVRNLRVNGIDCRLPTGGSFRLHKYGEPWRGQETPRADKIHETGLFIGNAPYDIEEKVTRAANIIKETME